MERLTKKEDIYIKSDGECEYKLTSSNDGISILKCDPIEIMNLDKATEKLHEILEIEEEFGIDLITLFKAVMNGFWYKNQYGYHQVDDYEYVIDLESSRLIKLYEEDGEVFYFEDYGKEWALTKQELEQ